ncbi:putative hydrolase or acyltransferase of alpha/beta superfamily [Belliella baltica DSM 15883]|uniref:Putative hydrolase or acyltransferase of alpha/beta superfamily n=1 Tax=Belliella baltica (strain DSM 15883 / CIP 108006 / LMG 21964 / BA134) TaxID=866536 RepID=I3Z4C4_BELBD|nr:alpha/beta fold hydrolase [Belliella baltica]AFL84092.1 putative hydrolase or acyltransferase of alpha/beta superfamily [Belliella baltica DSM 15883]
MKLNFRKTGSGEPMIILHGLFGSADNWFSIAKELEKDFTLYLVDQRNHGDSPHSDEWNYKVMAEDINELMEEEGIEKAFFMGHSMGGKTVMNFALRYPEKVMKLIVADIAPRHYPVHHQTILEGLSSVNLSEIRSRKEADEQLAKFVPEPGIRQFLLKSLGRNGEGDFIWKINLSVIIDKIENVGEALDYKNSFDKPTLFMGGENSNYIQDKDKADIDRYFPNSHLIYIKNAGHWLHAEQPQAVIDTVKAFLK